MKKILLADDHSFIRLGLTQLLRDEFPSALIREVANGADLVNEVMQEDWDLVISDLDMPGISGLEALPRIKSVRPKLPVLILSIFPEDLYALRALKAGASGYLNKNAAPEELITAIQRISQGRRYVTAELAEQLLSFPNDGRPLHELLTNKELEIFKQIALGRSVSQIAESLFVAVTTVSTHRSRILEKLKVSTNADLTRYALANQIISDI